MTVIIFLFFVIACLVFTSSAYADALDIKAVDIYPGGAKFTFAFVSDSSDFEIEIPGAFQENSVRILNLLDTEGINIFTSLREMWIPSSLQELKAEIDKHQQNINGFLAKQYALEQTKRLLENAQPPVKTDAKDIISYIQMAQDMKLKTENELTEIGLMLDKEKESMKLLESEFEKRMPYNSDSSIKITGHLKVGNIVVFEAFTRCVNWTPAYTMNLDSKSGKITTHLYSKTSQRTGLDYSGTIFFHTKLPNEEVESPEAIAPLHVHTESKISHISVTREREKYSYKVDEKFEKESPKRAKPKKLTAEKDYDDAEDYDDIIQRINNTTTFEPTTAITLTDNAVKSEGTLTGDGIETEFVLGDIELNGKTTLEVIPEQNTEAWILVNIDNVSKPMIPGKATLRVDRHQTGSTYIPEYGFGKDSIPFGYVSHITAQKEKMPDKNNKKETSLFNVIDGGYTIKVTNDMQESKTVVVHDRLPVSSDKKVKVDVKKITPAPKEQDKNNVLTWELDINSGKTAEIKVKYTLSYPLNETISYDD